MNTRRHLLYLFILTSFALLLGAAAVTRSSKQLERVASETGNIVVKQGISIAMQIDSLSDGEVGGSILQEGDDARMAFTLLDAANQEPLTGLHPAVWLSRQNPAEKNQSCEAKIKAFLQGGLSVQPEANLNSYYILALNDNASISVIDPHKGFGGSKLITRVMLHSPGQDWIMSKDQKKLFVATPLSKEVAVVDTTLWKAVAFISFDAMPKRLALQGDGKILWVELQATNGDSAFDGVAAIDAETNAVLDLIETGQGEHQIAFSDDNRFAYVSNSDAKTISVIDSAARTVVETIKSASVPVSLVYSPKNKTLLAALAGGEVLVLDASNRHVITEMKLPGHLTQLRISGDGRWGFALSPVERKVFIIDMTNGHLVHSLDMAHEPDQIAFTETYAYIHSATSEVVSLIQLAEIGKNQALATMDFSAGQVVPGQTVSDAIVATPERMGVIVANPADKTLFYYMEGMAAPMGSFDNYGFAPEAVMILDRSIKESEPGIYVGMTKMPPAGLYSAAILMHHPQMFHCFDVKINPSADTLKQASVPVSLEYLIDKEPLIAGNSMQVKVKVHQGDDVGPNSADLEMLIFKVPGIWHQRVLGKPLGSGTYQVAITPPEAGVYQLLARSNALNFKFEDMPAFTFHVAH